MELIKWIVLFVVAVIVLYLSYAMIVSMYTFKLWKQQQENIEKMLEEEFNKEEI